MRFYFNFAKLNDKKPESPELTELYYDEHYKEIRQRLLLCACSLITFGILSFIFVKPLTQILQMPAIGVKFFQLAPGEYFVATLRIATYGGLVFSLPLLSIQSVLFFMPDSGKENIIWALLIASITLFFVSLLFSFYVLIPAALQFFIVYNQDIIEPFWSFDQYCGFIIVLFATTAIVFQLPIAQVLIAISKIMSGEKMLSIWRYVLMISTILAAILTPSADPLTQILLTSAMFSLYMGGGLAAKTLQSIIQ
jgi:sec-independent protein translocase protein TatC